MWASCSAGEGLMKPVAGLEHIVPSTAHKGNPHVASIICLVPVGDPNLPAASGAVHMSRQPSWSRGILCQEHQTRGMQGKLSDNSHGSEQGSNANILALIEWIAKNIDPTHRNKLQVLGKQDALLTYDFYTLTLI
ncbi:hypothetical protein H4582DRAFT_2065552 [Lactarius indigo]|nr:hypothetical protein H4582DRAFT_2065552 [Lactarius indigo]